MVTREKEGRDKGRDKRMVEEWESETTGVRQTQGCTVKREI